MCSITMNESYINKILEEKESLTPKTGYNIVLFDDYSPVGEKLTLVDHVETEEEAEKVAKEVSTEENPAYIYGGNNDKKSS